VMLLCLPELVRTNGTLVGAGSLGGPPFRMTRERFHVASLY